MVKRIRITEDSIVNAVACCIAALFLLLTGVPFFHVVSKAFSSETALIANRVTVFPIGLQFDTLLHVVRSSFFGTSFVNSVLVTLAGSLISLVVTAMGAYPLSKSQLPLRKPLTILFVFTMWFSGGTVPTYLLMRQLRLTNTLFALILPAAINVYNLLLVKNYYQSIPDALEESAKIDGAGAWTTLFLIVLPLSLPVFATVSLFLAVGLWNDYYAPMMYLTRSALKTLPVYLRDIIVDSQADTAMASADDIHLLPEGVRSATIVASTLPILLVYPFVQKYFLKGVMIGAVKG